MHRHRRIFFLLVAAAAGGLVLAGAPERVAQLELFRVGHVEVEGLRHLTADEVRAVAAVLPTTSIWDDTGPVADRVGGHPMVREAEVRRQLPSTLRVRVEEREPVALAPVPVVSPVDREGLPLPLDPLELRMDLPLLLVERGAEGESGQGPSPAAHFQRLAEELARLEELDPDLAGQASEIRAHPSGHVVLTLSDSSVEFLYHPPAQLHRLRQGLRVYTDARERSLEGPPSAVDLRFADQVVVRFNTGTGS